MRFPMALFFLAFLFAHPSFSRGEEKTRLPAPTIRVLKLPAKNPPEFDSPIPGWLGFAALSPDSAVPPPRKYSWTPSHPKITVALFCDESTDCKDWRAVRLGTRFLAIHSGGEEEIELASVSSEPYGCEANRHWMAGFTGKNRIPEGPVWIVPASAKGEFLAPKVEEQSYQDLASFTESKIKIDPKGFKLWRVGDYRILLEKRGTIQARLQLGRDHQFFYQTFFKKALAGDWAKKPLDLSILREQFGIPHPIGAFQFKQNPVVMVFWMPGYEGNSFLLFLADAKSVKSIEAKYMYYCAF